MRYSNELRKYDEVLSKEIQEAILEIKGFIGEDEIDVLKYNDFTIVIPLSLKINLPSKGTHDNIDIRQFEPILVSFNINNYPTTSPRIKSDRVDFPAANLSHLYTVTEGQPPTLCLVRENLDEWFANRRISDLIFVAKQWFSKAANGLLSEDADEFEPVRLEGYRGYFIYKHVDLSQIVENNKRYIEEIPFSYLLLSTKDRISSNPTFKLFTQEVTTHTFKIIYEVIAKFNIKSIKANKINGDIDFPLLGLLLWSTLPEATDTYSTSLPRSYKELKEFTKSYDILIDEALKRYLDDGLFINNLTTYIPVTIAIKRPKKLIGFESEFEFLHFVICATQESITENKISPDTKVFFQAHREPISSHLAQKLSLSNNQKKTVFIGAGALGSKLIFHYARSGNFNLNVIDNDSFSPHNIVRHDLFMESVGKNKAKAVVEKIKDFLEDNNTLKYHTGNIFNYDKQLLNDFDWLIDTSASLNVQNWLVNSKLDNIPNRARAEIAYKGNLGFLYIEGKNQNPRIDDLVNYVYFLGVKIDIVSQWLIEEHKKKEGNDYDIVDIGIGCNSPTVIMPNNSMSFHSSIFSKILNHEFERKNIKDSGFINLSYISENGFDINSSSFLLSPFASYECCNNSGWEIRMLVNVLDKMKSEAKRYKRKETGGIFIGICNYKTKTIHVFDTIMAPPDSKRSNVTFYRGIENLPEQVKQIKEITGGMIGYIGEWHTHPMGLDMLSGTDMDAVEKLKPLNDKYPIPTFISVLSKDKYLPFVF